MNLFFLLLKNEITILNVLIFRFSTISIPNSFSVSFVTEKSLEMQDVKLLELPPQYAKNA